MCKRTTTDPLVRMFLDRYRLNLLAIPRMNAKCGQVYLRNGRRVSSGVDVEEMLDEPVRLPPQEQGEALGSVSGTLSDGVSVDLGLGLLEGFLAAIGAGAVVSDVSAGYKRTRSASLRFSFGQVTRDSIEAGSLGTALEGRRFRSSHPLVQGGNEYFIATAVVRSPRIDVVAEDQRSQRVELGAEVVATVKAHGGVTVESSSEGQVSFAGETPLAIALELYELRFDDETGKLTMRPQGSDAVRLGRGAEPRRAFVAPDEDALLALDETEPPESPAG